MEAKRKQLFEDPKLYPEFYKPGQRKASGQHSGSAISIASTAADSLSASSDASSVAPAVVKGNRKGPIMISSDEEDNENTGKEQPARKPLIKQLEEANLTSNSDHPLESRSNNAMQRALPHVPPSRTSVPIPIEVPTRKTQTYPFDSNGNGHIRKNEGGDETIALPDYQGLSDPRMSTADTEKALRALVEDSINSPDDVDIDMKESVVEGFREGVVLMPHQILGRVWMRERESGKKKGGILADDMGLGKTIQTIARIVEGRPKKSDKEDGWSPSTLVICPVSLVSQWASEIKKMTEKLVVIEHHGQSRTIDPYKLQKAHVVITSYTTVASEHASFAPSAKDESSKSKSKKSAKSKGAAADSASESSDDLTRKLNVRATAGKTRDALFRVKWFRVVLDEAHNIKNRKTKSATACCDLQAKYRWCLTGTPMQNSVEELYSLLKFLRIQPLNEWQTFDEQIAKPLKSGGAGRAMKRLHVVLKAVMLRRTKNQILNGRPLLELPARNLDLIECQFDEVEKEFYLRLQNRMTSEVNKLVNQNANVNYTHVLVLLLRLRQACNHPSLVSKDYRIDSDAANSQPAKDDDDDAEDLTLMFGQMGVSNGKKCQLCQTSLPPGNDSNHCSDCVKLTAAVSGPNSKHSDLPPESAKIRKILEILREIDQRSDGAEKTIIFSQFTSMLNLIEPFLDAEGIKHVRYDGSMPKDKREASLEKIRNSKTTRCILISFKAGSTGLNLTACNNVILVDMWWNPALEDQAYDRAHRLGQTRDVNIYKLTIPETVETRILQLQDTKRQLTSAALSGDKIKNMKLKMDDLLALFRGFGGPGEDED